MVAGADGVAGDDDGAVSALAETAAAIRKHGAGRTMRVVDHMTRRTLLSGSLAATALPGADALPGQVIDVATHFYDTSRPQGVPWPSPKEPILYKPSLPDRYLAAVQPHKVDGVVVIEASPWLEDNLWLLMLADRTPLIKGVVGNIAPGHPDFRAALERFSKHPLWRGIRISGANVGKYLADAQAMGDLKFLMGKNCSLDILVGAPVYEQIARLSVALPDLRMIVGHLPLDDSDGLRALASRREIYGKVSGVVRKGGGHAGYALLDELWDVFGSERVLYASNWPACDMTALYPEVFQVVLDYMADKPTALRERYFWRNAKAAYRL
jgi:L-fuconolactonase